MSGRDGAGNRISGDIHAPRPWKTYDLRPANLTHTATRAGDTWQITVTAQALSLFATVQADVPGHFSDAAMMLFPGHPATITFTPHTLRGRAAVHPARPPLCDLCLKGPTDADFLPALLFPQLPAAGRDAGHAGRSGLS